jgi:hypothetical protein
MLVETDEKAGPHRWPHRGNGGGNILAGERLLQVLTPHPIEQERLHFINSDTTLRFGSQTADILTLV